jgi:NAD(P)-dependent dehydrogenase (short-subunit alcohol dehydrogenase family)
MKTGPLSGQVAIVTGASSGIGRDTALELARYGARLVLASRRAASLELLAAAIREFGTEVIVRRTDVGDPADAARLVEETVERFGRVDIVVCSAGQYIRGPVATRTLADFEAALRVNFFGSLSVFYTALPHMLKARSGALVAVSSVDGKKGLPLDAPYVASKFALTGFMDVLRQELRGSGVRALTILPARVDTPMIQALEVPLISRKISSARVARVIVRHLRRGTATEVIIPFMGPSLLVWINAFSPRLADLVVRLFGLEGTDQTFR